jgi:hypothetical protein
MTQAHQISPGHVNDKIIFPFWSGGRKSHNSDTPLVVGAFSVNPADYALAQCAMSALFRVVAANGNPSITTHALLYNVTDSEAVSGSTLNYTTTVMEKKEATLTVGAAAGNLKNSEKLYEVRIWVDAPTTPEIDTIELYSAHLILLNQVQ